MRIIAGRLKNRTITSPKNSRTHPMSEQVRGAIFNTLGDVTGLTILDCFAGTGAVGLEALSRGAGSAVLIENDRVAQRVILENIRALQLTRQAKLIKAGVGGWLETSDQHYDIVIADPPYHDIPLATILELSQRLRPGGTVVLSWPGKTDLPELPGLALQLLRQYGDAQLGYYQAA